MRAIALAATLLALPSAALALEPPDCPSRSREAVELRFLELSADEESFSGRLVLSDPAGVVDRVRVFHRLVDGDGAGTPWSAENAFMTPDDFLKVLAPVVKTARDESPEVFAVALDAEGEVISCVGDAESPVRLSEKSAGAPELDERNDGRFSRRKGEPGSRWDELGVRVAKADTRHKRRR